MKILMTNHRLQSLGGTELFVAEIAEALVSRGHQVCVFSTAISNPIADRLTNLQIPFITNPKACPFQPDIIHGQHHLEAITALCSWPLCPAIYFIHGATPWEETPPKHPRILSYLGTSPRFAWFVAETCGLPESSFIVAPNFFDSRRFTQPRPPNTTTGRALVFHNTMAPDGPAIKTLRSACETVGLKLDTLGNAFGLTSPHPEHILPDYDVVFAAGRSAIEAMASGCAVIPVSAEQSADWICPDNFADLAMRNFTAEVHTPPIDLQHIISELRRITPDQTLAITQLIRQEATIDRTTDILISAYTSAISQPLPSNPQEEITSLSSYLLSIAQRVKDSDERRAQLIDQKDRATARAAKWKQRASALTVHIKSLELKARTPWWKRLKRPL
jgi:hypothetical protein